MSGAEADVSSDGDSSFEDDEVPLPPSPLKEGTSEPFQVVLKGGSPWGFNLKGIKGTRTPVQISETIKLKESMRTLELGVSEEHVIGEYLRAMELEQITEDPGIGESQGPVEAGKQRTLVLENLRKLRKSGL